MHSVGFGRLSVSNDGELEQTLLQRGRSRSSEDISPRQMSRGAHIVPASLLTWEKYLQMSANGRVQQRLPPVHRRSIPKAGRSRRCACDIPRPRASDVGMISNRASKTARMNPRFSLLG